MIFSFLYKNKTHVVKTKNDDPILPQKVDWSGVKIEDFDLLLSNQYGRDGHIFDPQRASNANIKAVLTQIFWDVKTTPPLPSISVDYIT